MEPFLFLIAILSLVLALVFAFTNGFHDASSTVATMIACGAATPESAVILSAAWGFAGAMLGGTAVALTMLSLLTVPLGVELVYIMFASVASASAWNLVTWRFGIPSSSTHALVGGLIGGAIAASGLSDVNWGLSELLEHGQMVGITKVVIFLFLSVLIGFVLGYITLKLSKFLLRNAHKTANRNIKRSQFLLSGLLSFSHGANDAQKVMGVMVLVIASVGWSSETTIPLWIMLASAIAMTIGTLGGGWKIIKTLAQRIFRIKPIHSFDSLVSSTAAVLGSTFIGAPVSSTHVVASSIMGVGAGENAKMVQWSMGKEMVYSWLLTIPVAAIISGLIYLIVNGLASI
ncbi:MAG: Phosphate transporter family protein [Methanomassiliicoccales archaeon PtaU1.Bin124]|nr:MAG: Phosphate transporter family protein [Methanomassiliicoccales archaeon PtaU1.Bin124]